LQQARRPPCSLGSVLSLLLLMAGCAPVFSDLQSARLVGKARVEATPSVSALYYSDSSTDHVENHAGVQLATGVLDRVDLRLRYEYAFDVGVNVVGFGPKVALVKDRLALALPVGFAFGGGVDSGKSWQIHPTLITTAPLGRNAEWNSSFKVMIPLSGGEGNDTLLAVNTGFGLSSNLDRWVVRPEVGLCYNPGDKGHFTQASVGLTVFLGPPPPKNAGGR
jgi:hypothetical protein